jgi:molybdopterin/thiamine biosynthesis adenylyltransferase
MTHGYSVAMTDEIHAQLYGHLIRTDGQEDLCFATYAPSSGSKRYSGLVNSIILPNDGERIVHGNVAFLPEYFERVLSIAGRRKEGIAFLHSHIGSGWQGMSPYDEVAELRIAPAVKATTGLPILGLTLGTDGTWSARFWKKVPNVKRLYSCHWCENVRVIGSELKVSIADHLLRPHFDPEKQLRTISAWGEKTQQDLSRLRVGIVGLGSVGSVVAETLARIGISYLTLIDFDSVEPKNLDRLSNVFKSDIGRSKVDAIRDAVLRSASSPAVEVSPCECSICEEEGFKEAINCDILFSCVDRPWPRQVLNFIAYAHLVPVIDGGILVRTNRDNTRMIGADWKAQTVGYKRPCLECLGQYKTDNAILERKGLLDDSSYIAGLSGGSAVDAHENVFAFSAHLASMQVLQMLSLFVSPSGVSDVGQQVHHFTLGTMEVERGKACHPNCFFQGILGRGDFTGVEPCAVHDGANLAGEARAKGNARIMRQPSVGP